MAAIKFGRQKGQGSTERPYVPAGQLLFSTTEVAAIIGVSKHTVLRWAHEGKIKAGRLFGGHFKIHRNEVLRLVEELYSDMGDPE